MTKVLIDSEVVEQVLEALIYCEAPDSSSEEQRFQAAIALRVALEQPQDKHEPVGEAGPMPGADGFTMACFRASDVSVGTELYTHPQPKREPLTGEAVLGVAKSIGIQFDSERLNEQIDDILAFARAIEAAHDIKDEA